MSDAKKTLGRLLLVPTPLDFGCADAHQTDIAQTMPLHTLQAAAHISHWITENAKSTRAFLKRVQQVVPLLTPMQTQHMQELPRHVHKQGDHQSAGAAGAPQWQPKQLLAPALDGHDMGLICEAGMPAIADPGSSIVRAAHDLGLEVVALQGPVSLMLALASSGLNGQNFAFVGYVPVQEPERSQRLQELEKRVLQTQQTQIFIETPYRNEALLQALLRTLKPSTRLSVSAGLGLPSQADDATTYSTTVQTWRTTPKHRLNLSLPAVFLMGG